jgi:hypothetical protein
LRLNYALELEGRSPFVVGPLHLGFVVGFHAVLFAIVGSPHCNGEKMSEPVLREIHDDYDGFTVQHLNDLPIF